MKSTLLILSMILGGAIAFATSAKAETQNVITPSGSYMVIQQGSTTQVIQTGKGNGPTILPAVPVTAGSSGWGTVITPQGSFMTNGTTIIQTGKRSSTK